MKYRDPLQGLGSYSLVCANNTQNMCSFRRCCNSQIFLDFAPLNPWSLSRVSEVPRRATTNINSLDNFKELNMGTIPVSITIVDGKTTVQKLALHPAGQAQALHIKAIPQGHYLLADEKGLGPQNITVKRVGKDLHITHDDADQPQVIIEGFYDSDSQLSGMTSDGNLAQYSASDTVQEHDAAFLMEGVSAPQVLAAESLAAGGLSTPALVGLGLLGLGATALALSGGGGGGNPAPATPASIPPAAPTLDAVINGDHAEPIPVANGGATNDNTPLIIGTGENGSIVSVYASLAGGVPVLIGTAVVADGMWQIPTTAALADGQYVLSAVASNGAGLTTPAATAWTVEIDTIASTEFSSISSITKDSGVNNTDFLTNDGRGGRLIQGIISSTLAPGEKVQVSTDGGTTWFDTFQDPKGSNRWIALDSNSHTDNWTIMSRVIDAAGNVHAPSISNTAVILDTAPPDTATSFAVSGPNVTVTLDLSGANPPQAGDTVQVVVTGQVFEHTLTATNISAGTATLSTVAGVTPLNTAVAIIDPAGNASLILEQDASGFVTRAPDIIQTIGQAGTYFGDDADNTFNIADVSWLDSVDSLVSGGTGKDILALTGADQSLDLGKLLGKLNSIETIDLTGSGNNTLQLSPFDVLTQGSFDLFHTDGKVQMTIKGNAGDEVNLEHTLPNGFDPTTWVHGDTPVIVDGVSYEVYVHFDAELLIQQGVAVNLLP
jgi:hypothetical protein